MPDSVKELRFFTLNYKKGLKGFLDNYKKASPEAIKTDISPVYLIDLNAAEKIYSILGDDVKFVFMLRHPIDRLVSQYNMEKNLYHEDLSIEKAIFRTKTEMENVSQRKFGHRYGFNYIGESKYSEAVLRYLKFFKISNIRIIVFEEFINSTEKHMKELCCFLGIDEKFQFETDISINSGLKASRFIVFDRILNKLKKARLFRYILRSGTKTSLQNLRNKIMKYEKGDSAQMSDECYSKLQSIFQKDTKLLSEITCRSYDIWEL